MVYKNITTTDEHENNYFSLKPNNNTLKCELQSAYEIDFSKKDSIGELLGFSNRILPANILHESDIHVDIVTVVTIRIECNIAKGCFYGNVLSHTIFEFAPSADPGYAIDVEPNHHIYLPVIENNLISNITVSELDQNSNLINFRDEQMHNCKVVSKK